MKLYLITYQQILGGDYFEVMEIAQHVKLLWMGMCFLLEYLVTLTSCSCQTRLKLKVVMY